MIITVSNLYGSGAIAVAHIVAEQLGYDYIDEQLPVVVAKRLKTSPEAVDSAENEVDSVGERMLRALGAATPETAGAAPAVDFSKECLREVQEAVRDFARHGNIVIIGRGAGFLLGRRPDVLRVFMHAPRDWRITHIAEGHGVEREVAEAEVARIDRARSDYVETHYAARYTDARNYDLALDTSAISTEAAAKVIIEAVHAR